MSRRNLPLVLLFVALLQWLTATLTAAQPTQPTIYLARIEGVINPVTATYVQRVLAEAEQNRANVLLIEMDTPGGLMDSMRVITGSILNARVPVVVYVAPQGARAASAGVFVTMSAHVAAMAPNTNIGSAHPVGGQGEQLDETMSQKVVNDAVAQVRDLAQRHGRNADWAEKAVRESVNVGSREAVDLKVVDLLADDRAGLLQAINGRSVRLADGSTVQLSTEEIGLVSATMSPIESFLHSITDPTIAYLMLSLGGLALAYELTSPGALLPGVAGLLLVLFALYALGTLSVDLTGVIMIVVGLALMVGEVLLAGGSGVLGIGGLIALALGSMMLTQATTPFTAVSPIAVAAVVLSAALFFFVAARGLMQTRRRQVTTGKEGLIGALGTARNDLQPTGLVFVEGELWEATAAGGSVAAGEQVRVIKVTGLRLLVAPVTERQPTVE
ncbi:MAG: NfeD family protein [Chloroflexota bacterium]